MLLLDSTHHHAEMARLNHHAHALRLDRLLYGFRDLGGQTFLNLQAAREDFDQPRNLAQPDHFTFGDISHVYFAEKWQHVMFAQAEHLNVFDNNHLVVGDGEERLLQHRVRIFFVAAGEKFPGPAHAIRSADQTLARRIFADTDNHFAH